MDSNTINPSQHIAPQGLPALEKQLERLLRDPNALRNDATYGKPWSDAENEAHAWVTHQQQTISQELVARGLAMSGRAQQRLILEIPFESAEKKVEGFLEARRCVLARLVEVRRFLDEQSTPSERIARHHREIARFESILGIDDHGVRQVEGDEEYGPVLRLVKQIYRAVEGPVRSNAGMIVPRTGDRNLQGFADSLIRNAKDYVASSCGKATAELLREIQGRLEEERLLLTRAVSQSEKPQPGSMEPNRNDDACSIDHLDETKKWFTKKKVPAIALFFIVVIIGVAAFLDAFDTIGDRIARLFNE